MRWLIEDLEKHLLIGSTLVEGSTLTEDDAVLVLAGRTVSGHPIHEIRELLNYRAAVEWLMGQLLAVPFLSADLVLGFHTRLFAGLSSSAGSYKTLENFTVRTDGSKHAYLAPHAVNEAVHSWVARFNAEPPPSAEEEAAQLYGLLQAIHPFEDGNGRIGRILIAYWLHWKFQKTFRFAARDKLDHLRAIEATNQGDFALLASFFQQRLGDEGA